MSKKLILWVCLVLTLGLITGTVVAEQVAYYPLDEGTGTVATDASGNGHHGTLRGSPAWVAGKNGQALEFPGTSGNNVDLGTWDPSDGTDQLSFAFWVRWNGQTGEWQGMISKRNSWNPAPIG
ncbi:MAG: hypothetical protein ACYS0H_28995, partial [Planctomycetota bacterium]